MNHSQCKEARSAESRRDANIPAGYDVLDLLK